MTKFVDYTKQERRLELRFGAFQPGSRLLLMNEWVETGAQALASV